MYHHILTDLARGVRMSLKFDEITFKRDYGHFARMLIVELSKPLPDSLMLEVGEDCLSPSLDYENVLTFLFFLLLYWSCGIGLLSRPITRPK